MKLWFQFVKSIERLCSNKGKVYVDQNLSQYLEENGVSQELKCVNSPQQNGVSELLSSKYLFQNSDPISYDPPINL